MGRRRAVGRMTSNLLVSVKKPPSAQYYTLLLSSLLYSSTSYLIGALLTSLIVSYSFSQTK